MIRSARLARLAVPALVAGLALAAAPPAQAGQPDADIVTTTRHDDRSLALTFDDGPDPEDTLRLLGVLREHHVKATFCLWGDHVREHPEIARAIARDGHTLCNHTMHHEDLTTWTPEQVRADLEETSAVIREAVPGAHIPYFRAPYGAWGRSPQVAADLGMQPLGWALVVGDWDPPGTEVLVDRIATGVAEGSVVLLHDGGGDRSQTVDAVDRVIPLLREDGWRFDRPARTA